MSKPIIETTPLEEIKHASIILADLLQATDELHDLGGPRSGPLLAVLHAARPMAKKLSRDLEALNDAASSTSNSKN